MIRSLKAQTALLLISLICILVFQGIMASRGLLSVDQSNQKLTQSFRGLGVVNSLERDLLALQSIVLIYKETGSRISQTRFDNLMDNIWTNVAMLLNEGPMLERGQTQAQDIIRRMEQHLKDYQSNFQIVIDSRKERARLLQDNIDTQFDNIDAQIRSDEGFSQQNKDPAIYHLASARAWSYRYLISPEPGFERRFYEHMTEIKSIMANDESISQRRSDEYNAVTRLERDFSRLTQVTRGYVFLVNVVMAGSANEFLYSTSELRNIYESNLRDVNSRVALTSAATERMVMIVSIACFSIAAVMAGFLFLNIFQPIYRMTAVFRRLSDGEDVSHIPGVQRRNEIGFLAQAANVFRKKNAQTEALLQRSEKLNTDLHELNKEITHEKERAEAATIAKSNFLANMSHEIRTPMNAVKGLIELALATDDETKRSDYLKKVAYSGGVMLNVIDDILDYSKLEADKLTIDPTRFSLSSLIDNLISTIGHQATDKGLNLRVLTGPSVPEYIVGDPYRISQVLLNLTSNAIKFTHQGCVCIRFDVERDVEHDVEPEADSKAAGQRKGKCRLVIDVEDSGIGMDEQQLARVFESFEQADGSISRGYGGTGLGLSIVKSLVRLMGGNIHTTSAVGRGTTFRIEVNIESCTSAAMITLNHASQACLITDDLASLAWTLKEQDDVNVAPISELAKGAPSGMGDRNCLIIELSKIELLHENQSLINYYYSTSDKKIGFIVNAVAAEERQFIQHHYSNAPLLCHPFSPADLNDFLDSVTEHSSEGAQAPQLAPADGCNESRDSSDVTSAFQGHILLVEDNDINQLVAGEVLKSLGLTHDIAENGEIAVAMAAASHYDLILMDIQMPVMDGYEATQAIRKAGSKLPICALSANVMKNEVDNAHNAGMDAYLRKPLEVDELIACLKRFLPYSNRPTQTP